MDSNPQSHQGRDIRVGNGNTTPEMNDHAPALDHSNFSPTSFDDDLGLTFLMSDESFDNDFTAENTGSENNNQLHSKVEQEFQFSKLFELRIESRKLLQQCSAESVKDFATILLTAAGLNSQAPLKGTSADERRDDSPDIGSVHSVMSQEALEAEKTRTLETINKIIDVAEYRVQQYEEDGDTDFHTILVTAINSERFVEKQEGKKIKISEAPEFSFFSESKLETNIRTFEDLKDILAIRNTQSIDPRRVGLLTNFFNEITQHTIFVTRVFNEASSLNTLKAHTGPNNNVSIQKQFLHSPLEISLTDSHVKALHAAHTHIEKIINVYARKVRDLSIPQAPELKINFTNTNKAPAEIEVMTETLLQLLAYSRGLFRNETPLQQFYSSGANELNVFFQAHSQVLHDAEPLPSPTDSPRAE
ncbi:MAG: hypothetical protein I8H77_17470 [Comamonadaceae bacterium]|nr:hypothetical protein [Comamonadaceae bacterium]